jgi:large repetitive protein
MSTPPRRISKSRLTSLAAAVLLASVTLAVGSAGAGPATPNLLGPADGTSVDASPAFAWQPVPGADRYEFELSADPGFNSKVAGASTRNTRATLKGSIPNGDYFWRVRAVNADGEPGVWSGARGLRMAWATRPSLLAPANDAVLIYPSDPFKLSWSPVSGALEYLVRVATDPALGNLVWSSGPYRTAATTFTLAAPLAPGTYYWGITPLNSEGHAGAASTVASFRWEWPSTTTLAFTDLADAPEMVDPYFSWNRVPGAAGYEVEVSSSSDWAPGSKVCCPALRLGSPITTLGLSLSPTVALDNNTYYWRVRAIDPSGNAGVWNVGPSFTKTFANVPPTPAPSVKNLRLRDNLADPFDGVDPASISFPRTTAVPVVTWDPVPGASSYQVDVTPFVSGACDWAYPSGRHWTKMTATNAWTPLGWSWIGVKPFPSPAVVSTDLLTEMVSGWQYCVRVRPVDRASSASGPTIFGDWTYLPQNNVAAFQWSGPPGDATCTPCTLAPTDYLLPQTGSTTGRMPLFTWQPITGAKSYYVVVARDPNFTNVVDYAYTRIPAYAPRTGTQSKGYADELTQYYWAVLPAREANGGGVSANPLEVMTPGFHKQSVPPTRVAPAPASVIAGPTTFRWTPVEAARRYRLEVAQDANFSNVVETAILTDSTAYTSNTTYPADTVLYWRVRADAEDGADHVGLSWSATGTFQKQLPAPIPDPTNPTAGAFIPTIAWSPVPGAVSYDMHVEEADGDRQDFSGYPSHAAAFRKMTGVGIFKFQVRANFPTASGPVVKGPYSPVMSFTHTMPEPAAATADVSPTHALFSWNLRPGAKQYRIQVSTRADFSAVVDNATTQAPNYAPLMTQPAYTGGGRFYWRVAAMDVDNNTGDWSKPQEFALPQTLRLRANAFPIRGRKGPVMVTVMSSRGPVAAASIRLWGAGLRARVQRTDAQGRVTFTVTPRKRGRIYVAATKAGYVKAQTSIVVRARR